jgi:hypothetical protein
MKQIMIKRKFKLASDRMANVRTFCAEYGLIDATKHGVKRGIYFGTTGNNSMQYLKDESNVFEPDLKSTTDIAKEWYIKYAYPRINDLIKRNKISIKYDYDTYYADADGKDRHRKKKELLKKQNIDSIEADETNIRNIINYWLVHNGTKSLLAMEKELGVDRRTISRIIFQNDYNFDTQKKARLHEHIESRKNIILEIASKEKNVIHENTLDDILNMEYRYWNALKLAQKDITINIKKTKLFLTSQKYDNIKTFSRTNICINNIKKGCN